jgi:hypothetical protein
MNVRAARMGPTVCELDGPMPMVNKSNVLMGTAGSSPLSNATSLVRQPFLYPLGEGVDVMLTWDEHSAALV